MENNVVVQTLKALNRATGEWNDWPVDEVRVNDRRVALVHHVDNAPLCMLRILTEPTLKSIHEEVRRQRSEQGKPTIADAVSRLPEPDNLKAAMKLAKKGA